MMSTTKKKEYKNCIKCNISEKKLSGIKKYITSDIHVAEVIEHMNIPVAIDDYICNKCYTSLQLLISKKRKVEKEQNQPTTSFESNTPEIDSQLTSASSLSSQGSVVQFKETVKPSVEYIELPFQRTISTHRYCFLCGKSNNLVSVPFHARKEVFIKKRIFIPNGNRCCASHLIKKRFYNDEIATIRVFSNSSMVEVSEVIKLLDSMSLDCDKELTDRVGDFTLPEERLKVLTSLNWEEIIKLREMMISTRNSENRNVTQALVVFLFKLRSGNSNNIIAAILGLDRPQQVSEFTKSVLKSFKNDVLPSRFGLGAVFRQDLIKKHTSPVAKKIHNILDDQLAIICDGTYLRHQKSTNNEYQRKSYSGQKKVPLCKPFTVCATDGFIIDTLGPFNANQNDAKILENLLQEPEGLSYLLNKGDVFFVDRGFRDVVSYLENKNYKVLMPSLKGKNNQLTTAEANNSRRVTMVRWVVEAVHGVIGQKWKLLHNQFDNKLLEDAGLYCKIACFLHNEFGSRFVSRVSTDEILSQIRNHDVRENTLSLDVMTGKWSRRKVPFKKLTSADVMDFPEMTEKDLELLFTGTYQLQLTISYLAELMNDSNEINLQYLRKSPDIIKIQVRSRHVNSRTYNCYIQYKPDSIGHGGISRYYCECANGMRTIGCCAHVATVIYYLSHARFLSKIIRPAEHLTKLFNIVHHIPVLQEDSDEDN